jgi:hypothetical protein
LCHGALRLSNVGHQRWRRACQWPSMGARPRIAAAALRRVAGRPAAHALVLGGVTAAADVRGLHSRLVRFAAGTPSAGAS